MAHPRYAVNIGIEVHVQLTTDSKIFCPCPNNPDSDPNTNICVVCTGQPGSLPVLNARVVDNALRAGLATHSQIAPVSEFARKHYFYPDLPKNYQITQADKPICTEGFIAIRTEKGTKKIRLTRIHLEEDAGKNIHAAHHNETFVDLNRAGTPLLEIVSYPDIESAEEAKAYLKMLRATVMYLEICTGSMEEGALRADTNISVRPRDRAQLGTKVELKNINSFKFIGDAIEYEIGRQIELLERGEAVKQETRLWDTKERKSVLMRSKEEAADYRYFPDPDLPLLCVDAALIESVRSTIPELPAERFGRYCAEGLTPYAAEILVDDRSIGEYFETARAHTTSPLLINWILKDLLGFINDKKIALHQCQVTPTILAELVNLIEEGTINNRVASELFIRIAESGGSPRAIVEAEGLKQVRDSGALEKLVAEIIVANPKQVADYKAGKEKLFGFFVGQAMAKTRGTADPKVLDELIRTALKRS
jgi:aspartyl-tRNA(Asn)/glutamyl-tRNA(Gln) amidotransferase subunit B